MKDRKYQWKTMISNSIIYSNNRSAGYMILLCISINCVFLAALIRLSNDLFYGTVLLLLSTLLLTILILTTIAKYRLLYKSKCVRLSTDGSLLLVHFLPYFLIGNVLSELVSLLIMEIHDIYYYSTLPYQAIAGVFLLLALKHLKLVVYSRQTVYMSNFWEDKNILMKQVISINKVVGLFYKITFMYNSQVCSCYFIPHLIKPVDTTTGNIVLDQFTAKCYQSHLSKPTK